MCTVEQLLAGDQAVPVVQEQGHEDLPGLPAQAVLQIAADRGRVVADRFAVFQLGSQVAVGQFQPGSQRTAARRAEPGQAGQVTRGAVQQHPQRAVRLQQVARGLHGIAATEPGAEKQGQQFGVGKCRGPARDQLLAGAFLFGPVMDGHACIIASLRDGSHRCIPQHRVGRCLTRVGSADSRTVPGCSAGPACAWLRPSAG